MNRRAYFRLHQWVGLGLALWLVLVAVTGVLLTFREQFRTEAPRVEAVAQPLPLDELVAIAAAHGGEAVTDVTIPTEPEAPYVLWLDDDAETKLYMDGRGTVLAQEPTAASFNRVVFELHTGATFGLTGSVLSFVSGIGLCLLVQSGLVMLWKRRRRPRLRTGVPADPEPEREDRAPR